MLSSDARRQNLVPPAHGTDVIGTPVGGEVAVVSHHDKASQAIRVHSTQTHQFSVNGLQIQASKLSFKLSESTRGLLVLLGLSCRADDDSTVRHQSDHQPNTLNKGPVAVEGASSEKQAQGDKTQIQGGIHPAIQARIEAVKQGRLLDSFAGRALKKGAALSGVDMAHGFGLGGGLGGRGGGGLRNGGACAVSCESFSMGGPFGVVDGVGALTVPKCDRPPYTWPEQAANDDSYVLEPARLYEVRYTLRDGSTGQLSVISRSRAGALGRVQRDQGPNLRLVSARVLP